MDKKNIIKKSVLAGKKIFGEPLDIPSLQPLYNELLKKFVIEKMSIEPPELLIYSSFNKTTETKFIENEETGQQAPVLLFDTHLLDVFGEFAEAYLAGQNADDLVERLTYKLFAEKFYTQSKIHEAIHFSYCFRASRGMVTFSKERNTDIARNLLVQEAFILAHELSHWYLFRCDEEEKNIQLTFKRKLWLDCFEKLIENRRVRAGGEGLDTMEKMRDYIITDDDIIEECACDTFAAIFLIEFMELINGFSKIDIATSSFVCIQNLQLISYLEHNSSKVMNENTTLDKLSFEMTLRMIIYKYHIHDYLYTYSRGDEVIYDKGIIKCKEQYDTKVLSPFIKTMNKVNRDLMRIRLIEPISFLDESWEAYNQLLKRLLIQD